MKFLTIMALSLVFFSCATETKNTDRLPNQIGDVGGKSFASTVAKKDCCIQCRQEEMPPGVPLIPMEIQVSKIKKQIKKYGIAIVQNEKDANIGLDIQYIYTNQTSTTSEHGQIMDLAKEKETVNVDHGPYADTQESKKKLGFRVAEYREERLYGLHRLATTNVEKVAELILKYTDCVTGL